MTPADSDAWPVATASVLGAIAVLHVAWGRGSNVPFASRAELAEAVVGKPEVPPARACYAVAALLGVGAASVTLSARSTSVLPRLAAGGTAFALAVRCALGFAGRTDLVSPGSNSPRFRRLDRRLYAPLCGLLAVGAACSARGR